MKIFGKEYDIPFIQNPWRQQGNTGAVPFLQNPFNDRSGKQAGFLPTEVKPASNRQAAPTADLQQVSFADPLAGDGGWIAGGDGYGGGVMTDPAELARLRDDIRAYADQINAVYESIFGNLEDIGKERIGEIGKTYGENVNKVTGQYTSSIPRIEGSYAALGAGDSTDTRDAKIGAQSAFNESVETLGDAREADEAKVGSFLSENKARYGADQESLNRLVDRVDETQDLGDLRSARNDVEDRLGQVKADEGSLMTDEGARGKLAGLTKDGGRFAQVTSALDNVLNSSMAGSTKAGAVKAIIENGGLSDEEKQKVKLQYGDVYNEVN